MRLRRIIKETIFRIRWFNTIIIIDELIDSVDAEQFTTRIEDNYKEDNILDYLNNPDFRYFADSQTTTLDPVKLDGLPSEKNISTWRHRYFMSGGIREGAVLTRLLQDLTLLQARHSTMVGVQMQLSVHFHQDHPCHYKVFQK